MARQLYQVVHRKEAPAHHELDKESLPHISYDLLGQFFGRLSAADKINLLQHKILPVAMLPNITLYAAAGRQAAQDAVEAGHRVVAQVVPAHLSAAIKRNLGPEILRKATHGLRLANPSHSAFHRLTLGQGFWFCALAGLLIFAQLISPAEIFYCAISLICGLFFLSVVSLRVLCLFENSNASSAKAAHLNDEDLPVYSVLVPVFRETRVLNQLITALLRLKYPIEKLDIKLILEETDTTMQRAVAALSLPEHFDVIVVPAGSPQTKPRALNYALQFARGTLLTIFDAEDVPEPTQLRKAAAQFHVAPDHTACLQAELCFYNPNENWLTRQFAVEYATLFKLMLPAFFAEHLPLPLGGTSNHFRISHLRAVGAWDPFNVTEDADLGLRLARLGYRTAMLDSATYEEATSNVGNWLNQRSRWLKGFMQTWLVHMRNPIGLWNDLGIGGYFAVQAFLLGVVVSALFHPLLLAHCVYVLAWGGFPQTDVSLTMMIMIGLNIVVFGTGYGFSIFAGYKALRSKRVAGWWLVLVSMPFYWLLISLAGWMALGQLIVNPHYWNKTRHGLSRFQKP